MQQAPPQQPADEQARGEAVRCPTCGAEAEPGQLVCLECGSRISLGYRRPPSWKLPVAIIVAVALLVIAGVVIGLHEVTKDADAEVARDQAAEKPNAAKSPAGPATPAKKPAKSRPAKPKPAPEKTAKPKAAKPKATPKPTRPAATGIRPWPGNTSAYAVVLVSTDSRANAVKVARRAIKEGVDGAGVLRSDDYSNLGRGLWISFGGVYKSRAQAAKDAKRFDRGFPGAFVQFVDGKK